MKKETAIIKSGLEARPVALFVQTASKFTSDIKVILDNKTVNAKSIMGMISLGIIDGNEITLTANGEDATLALQELKELLESF